jgi:hypothetical protein
MWLARRLPISCLSALRTLRSQAFFHLFNLMGLQRLQRKSALNCSAPISVEFAKGKHWSNAAWPA